MRSLAARASQLGSGAPGTEVCVLASTEDDREMGMVSLYANIPNRGIALSYVRLNLFGMLSNTLQHIASALCVPGTTGELITVSGHVADSYHVYAQATESRQDVTVMLGARACCASPKVDVRADVLGLAFADPEVGLGDLEWYPLVPWGGSTGAAKTVTVAAGSGTLVFPAGSRLIHWEAQGVAAATIRFDTTVAGVAQSLPNAIKVAAFPAAPAVSQVVYANLTYGLFDIVV